jgi:ATP-dependent 26S proteasome regulatory subunit
MHVILEFTFPDENYRKSIWQSIFPGEAPLHEDVDFERLAREIKLAGGNIKNIAMTAAYYAASNGRHIRMSHLMQAARREFQKLGRAWSETQPQ